MAGKSPQPKASEKVSSNNLRRLAPPLAFLAALCLMVVCFYDSGYTSLPPTGKRYDLAKASIDTLRQDEKRSGQREPWENLAAEFRAIYDADPGWPNRPAALFRAAESLEELARRSFAKADAKKAIECYEAVAQRHADSRLADDALFRAAKLRAAWLKDDKGALALLERIKSQYPKGDMITEAQALEKTLQAAANGRTAPEARQVSSTDGKEPKDEALPSKAAATAAPTSGTQSAPPADATPTQISRAGVQQPLPQAELLPRYRDAKAKMEALRADKVRSCWRQPWEELTTEFLRIYLSRKDWAISPGALFRAATSQEALSDCSHLADEYRQARDLYLKLAQEFPKSALADDALLRAAITTGGSKCVTRQSYSTSRPMTRMRVRRVVPGRTGGAEVISSEITDVSQRERFAGSVRYANTAAGSRSIRIVSATVNMPSSSPTPAFPGRESPSRS